MPLNPNHPSIHPCKYSFTFELSGLPIFAHWHIHIDCICTTIAHWSVPCKPMSTYVNMLYIFTSFPYTQYYWHKMYAILHEGVRLLNWIMNIFIISDVFISSPYLLNIWEFVSFVCGLSPPKRRVVRRLNFARRRVPTHMQGICWDLCL